LLYHESTDTHALSKKAPVHKRFLASFVTSPRLEARTTARPVIGSTTRGRRDWDRRLRLNMKVGHVEEIVDARAQ